MILVAILAVAWIPIYAASVFFVNRSFDAAGRLKDYLKSRSSWIFLLL
jgi:hypothetical protein